MPPPQKTAVILMTMGDPPSVMSIFPFLVKLFIDPRIIPAPWFIRYPLSVYISLKKLPEISSRYKKIGGGSPMNDTTEKQARLLEERLGEGYRVFVANRYCSPTTATAYNQIKKEGIRRIIALPLYPHFSKAITGSSFEQLEKLVAKDSGASEVVWIQSLGSDPAFARAFADKILEGLAEFPEADRSSVQILFSAHSLPHEFIVKGDPYLDEIRAGIAPLLKLVRPAYFHLCFQSKGRKDIVWLKPETGEVIEELVGKGRKNLLLVPISFVSENIETLYDTDILFGEQAAALGAVFRRTRCLDTGPEFIDSLAGMVEKA